MWSRIILLALFFVVLRYENESHLEDMMFAENELTIRRAVKAQWNVVEWSVRVEGRWAHGRLISRMQPMWQSLGGIEGGAGPHKGVALGSWGGKISVANTWSHSDCACDRAIIDGGDDGMIVEALGWIACSLTENAGEQKHRQWLDWELDRWLVWKR